MIECVGVLHHLRDPQEGWRIITGQLNEGGFMKIGLYSQRIRQALRPVLNFISKGGYGSSTVGIRQFRHDLYELCAGAPARNVLSYYDFYTTSECRDLLFHIQEHCFSIPQLERIIDDIGLEFVGFESTYPIEAYRDRFPEDPNATSLKCWHQLEQEETNLFVSMYQFWLRKSCSL